MSVNTADSKTSFNPFAGNAIEKVVPTTAPQKEILISCIISGDDANLAYNHSFSLLFTGLFNRNVLEDSLQELLNRNESLRCSFNADGTQMIIYSTQSLNLFYQDISSSNASQQDKTVNDYNRKDAAATFDLIDGPLIRFALFKKAEDKYLLTITAHHVVCDGWSWGIMFEQLSSVYNSKLKKEPLSDHPLLFSDYVKRVIDFSRSKEYAQIEKYWLDEYKNNIPSFEIQPDFPRPQLRTFKSNRYDYTLENESATKVKKVGIMYGCSFVNTLMSVFEILLYKHTGNNDIVIGLPTAGQTATEMPYLIGHCVNFLALRSHPDDELAFSEYLKIRKSKTLNDYEHQQFTYGSLLEKLNIKRDPSRIPLAPVSFNVSFGLNMNVSFDNVEHEIIYHPRVSETFELNLNITEGKNDYVFRWSYNTQLYAESTIKELMQKYIFLLQQIVNDPEQKIKDLYIEDRRNILQKLNKWNNTYKELPNKTVINLFEETVLQYPDNIAVQFQDQQFTYQQLNNTANKFAHYLQKQNLQQGNVVGVVLDRGSQIIITLLAILKCGATYVPIDPGFPEDRIRFMISDSETSFNIINAKYTDKFTSATKQIIFDNIQDELKIIPAENTPIRTRQTDIAYILYTSGSTGKPKGVMITQRNLLNFLTSMKTMFNTNEQTRLLSVTTVSFDIVGLEIYLPLISGSTLVLTDEETVKDGVILVNQIERDKINFIQATPATYKIMIEAGWSKKLPITILSGGEALPKNLAMQLLARGSALYNMYGPTETTIWSTVTQIFENDEIITIGKPIQNTQIYILDENKNILPEGKIGEIYIGGEGVANGYYNRAELTTERFVDNPFGKATSSKLYRTGDLGKFLHNGDIICLGRTDHQAKIRGYRIELGEIEYHISKLNNVKDVVVHIKQNNAGEQKLAAYIIPVVNDKLNNNKYSKEEIIQFRTLLRKVLPLYMIPDEWIMLSEFPLTPNKKVDKKALEKTTNTPLAINGNDKERKNENRKTVELIRHIWEEELSIKDIDEEDDFFELGGHSIIAIKVMSRIEKQIGSELPISTLFEHSTIKSLAEVIDTNKSFDYSKVVIPIKHTGEKYPIFLVHAGGLNVMLYKSLSQSLDEDQPLYGLQGLGLDGDLIHLKSMETIAQRYLLEVLEHDSDGPYIIMGYSYGGIIAYEMARQLLSMGKEVKVLGILDTNAFTGDKYDNKFQLYIVKVLRQFKKLVFFSKQFISSPPTFFKYQWLVFNRKYNKRFKDPEEEVGDYNKFVVKAYNEAYHNYVLRPLDIEIDLFKVQKRFYFIDDPVYLSWKKYALKGVDVYPVPGDHKTFMLPPNNKVLARTIQNVINNKFIFLLNALMFVN